MREICAFRVSGTTLQTTVSQQQQQQQQQLEHSITLQQETNNSHVSIFMEAIPFHSVYCYTNHTYSAEHNTGLFVFY